MYNAFMIKAAGIIMYLAVVTVIVADQRVMTDTTQIVQRVFFNVRSLAITVACCAWPCCTVVASLHAFPRKRHLELISKQQFT